jgi:hypothetical protein
VRRSVAGPQGWLDKLLRLRWARAAGLGGPFKGKMLSRSPLCQLFPAELPMALPLAVLGLQTALPIMIRLSRSLRPPGTASYNPGSLTLMAELLKCSASLACMSYVSASAGVVKPQHTGTIFGPTVQRFARAAVKQRWAVVGAFADDAYPMT